MSILQSLQPYCKVPIKMIVDPPSRGFGNPGVNKQGVNRTVVAGDLSMVCRASSQPLKTTHGSKMTLFMLTYILAIIIPALSVNAGAFFLTLKKHVMCIYVIFCSRDHANTLMH